MGWLSRITIYPIKSLPGASVSSVRILPSAALELDRRFALVDSSGQLITAKRTVAVHCIRTEYDLSEMRVGLSRSSPPAPVTWFSLLGRRHALEEWFSDYFRDTVVMEDAPRAGVPDDLEAGGPTIVAEETLHVIADWFDGLAVDEIRRRFRTNLEVSGCGPFWEDRLYAHPGAGRRFRVGSVELAGARPCQRCPVPARDSVTGEVTAGFIGTFSQRRRDTLPDWTERSWFDHFYRLATNTVLPEQAGGEIAVGEGVELTSR